MNILVLAASNHPHIQEQGGLAIEAKAIQTVAGEVIVYDRDGRGNWHFTLDSELNMVVS